MYEIEELHKLETRHQKTEFPFFQFTLFSTSLLSQVDRGRRRLPIRRLQEAMKTDLLLHLSSFPYLQIKILPLEFLSLPLSFSMCFLRMGER